MAAYDHYNADLDWRWSGATVTIFGISPTIVFCVVFILAFQLRWLVIILAIGYVALCIILAMRTYHGSVIEWLRSMRTRFLQRGEWVVR